MQKVIRLLKGSALQIYRDQMLLVLVFVPFLTGILLRILLPLADRLLVQYLQFSIQPYYLLADTFTLTIGPMMIGMMVGLLMLDERDDGISTYFAVTPVGGSAYLLSRLALPFVYSLAAILTVMSFASLGNTGYAWFIAPSLVSAGCGVFMTMLLVSIASNKVEGMAVSKLLGIVLFGIPLAWFSSFPWKLIGMVLPTYWVSGMLLETKYENTVMYFVDFAAGLVCTAIWIIGLHRLFSAKIK